jgi:secreted trypsin-like serine protease
MVNLRQDKYATQIPDELNEVGLKIIESDICENIHPDYENQLSGEMLCAGYKEGGKDACLGDSGGPLACQVGGTEGPWILYGITSWGIGCGDPLHPGVYARVTKLQKWVEEKTGVKAAIKGKDIGMQCEGVTQEETTTTQKPKTTRKPNRTTEMTTTIDDAPVEITDTEGTPADNKMQSVVDANLDLVSFS